jgi:hypothetical protein
LKAKFRALDQAKSKPYFAHTSAARAGSCSAKTENSICYSNDADLGNNPKGAFNGVNH